MCLIASQLLKSRHQRMSLVQQAMSVMLYGNASSKEVMIKNCIKNCISSLITLCLQLFMCLQPLNLCMSYQSSLNTIEKLSEDHDVEVQFWCDEMKEAFLDKKVCCYSKFKY